MNVPINSLGFDRIPAETRVVVAMSGGVDSAVTAAMLADQGYDVVGITLQLYDHGETVVKPGTCCASEDIHDARRVADHIGIPHYVLNYESRFRESVIEDFADSYIQGETPIPCIRCNQTVKFRDLLDTAMDIGADVLATGHYARRADGTEGPELLKAADPSRDQSYFLFATTRPQLDLLRFPLGDMKKHQPGDWRASSGSPSAPSPTARTSVSCPTAITAPWWRSCVPVRPGPATSSPWMAPYLAAMTASSTIPWASARGWASAA